MFCYQCQEAAKGTGCTISGACGKKPEVSDLQDALIYTLKGLSIIATHTSISKDSKDAINSSTIEGLFATITNANFDQNYFANAITANLKLRDSIVSSLSESDKETINSYDACTWKGNTIEDFLSKSDIYGILATENEDIRSLRELLVYGIKGIAAYAQHAAVLGYSDTDVNIFIQTGLAATADDSLSVDDLVGLVLECGAKGVTIMALLDKANTETYGTPEITEVKLGTNNNPGILISGHDLKDLEELLQQTQGSGVDIYTHSEMLPAHYYPEFKKYDNFIGNYGNAWWKQKEEFASFNGPVLMTTNCLVPPDASYKDRVYTTGVVGFEGLTSITVDENGDKDFSSIIDHAKKCAAPTQIEDGTLVGGFAHAAVMGVADKVVDAVKTGAIKQFFVMAGCDGRQKDRQYYTDFASALPDDTVILTAGCAKYRYNKLELGDIGGIPRVLDAGQCNDSYSLAVIALKLKEVFELEDINDLPISFNIAWYEQKAVIVLLALLSLGVKDIHLGPTLPAFLSPNVAKVLIDNFNIGGIDSVENDIQMFLGDAITA